MKRSRSTAALPPEVTQLLSTWGGDIAVARKRRRLTQRQVADRAFVGVETIVRLEKGDPGIGLGVFLSVLWALGLHHALRDVIAPTADKEGTIEEVTRLPRRVRRSAKAEEDYNF